MNNFIGKDGFNWWVGVIENRTGDPLKLGRCQVRIFGHHTDNKVLLPTEDLPWALPSLPINNSQNFSVPKEGDYVTGFFADGESSQNPIMTGVLPGLKAAVSGQSGFQDPRTPEEINSAPKPPEGVVLESVGQPTNSPMSRSVVENTLQGQAANNRTHNCDICSGLNKDIAEVKSSIMSVVKDARTTAEAAFASSEANPIVESAKETIETLKAEAKLIKKELQPIIDEVKAYEQYIKDLKDLIAYIQNLPTELQGIFAKCLSDATNSLKDALAVKSTLTDQTATLTAAQAEVESAISSKTDIVNGNVTTIEPELS
jgi:hypothetical protein